MGRADGADPAAWRTRRRGIFEGLPRLAYRRAGPRYLDVVALGTIGHGIAVAVFGTVMLLLYVDLTRGDLAAFALCSLAAYVVEGGVAAVQVRRVTANLRAWMASGDDDLVPAAWSEAARLPVAVLRLPVLYGIGAVGAAATDLLLAHRLGLGARDAALLLPLSGLQYLSSAVLRYVGLELGMRPVLEAAGARSAVPALGATSRVSLHVRLVAAIPTVTWATGVIVAGLLTDDSRRLDRIGLASVASLAVAAVVSVWLSLVLADAVSGPIVDLRDATRRVAEGDLTVRVPVVSTDESGQLAESFNAMVGGLDERERLRDALGVLVDPALAERVLLEGTDLQGDEVDATILFLDVRGFTQFAETAAPRDVVTALNTLYDRVVPVILRHGGHANRFLGDGLLAVFGAPERYDDHAARAVSAARELARLVGQETGGELRVGIGINTGRVVVGTVGGAGRRDFTVIGDTVNTAARVEAATRETCDDILLTEATLRALSPEQQQGFEQRPGVPLKGKSATIRLFAPIDGPPR